LNSPREELAKGAIEPRKPFVNSGRRTQQALRESELFSSVRVIGLRICLKDVDLLLSTIVDSLVCKAFM
jgi:hypothetical protein